MAIKQSKFTTGYGRENISSPLHANTEIVKLIEHTFTEAVATADILEFFVLPPDCRITELTMQTAGTGAATMSVGLMSGDAGCDDAARTVGTQLFNAQATPTTAASVSLANRIAVKPAPIPRSIGVQFSANVAAGESNKIMAVIRYASIH